MESNPRAHGRSGLFETRRDRGLGVKRQRLRTQDGWRRQVSDHRGHESPGQLQDCGFHSMFLLIASLWFSLSFR